jgi:ribonucleoside-diphosphate reductase alpha chain
MTIVGSPASRVRSGYTVDFQLDAEPATLTAANLPDGRLGEVFIRAGTHGSTLAGMTDALSTALTVALRHGVPPEAVVSG